MEGLTKNGKGHICYQSLSYPMFLLKKMGKEQSKPDNSPPALPRAQNLRQGIIVKTSFRTPVSRMGLSSLGNIKKTPKRKLGSFVQRYSFKFRAQRAGRQCRAKPSEKNPLHCFSFLKVYFKHSL